MRVLCAGGGLHAVAANRFLALTSQFPFSFTFHFPFIFKDYHPTDIICFLSCDMSTHYFSLSTAYYILPLSLISNYTWMITIHLKVKRHYEASPYFTQKLQFIIIFVFPWEIIIEISGISSHSIFKFTWSCNQSSRGNLPEILYCH